jgi:ribosomal protein L29
MSPKAELPTTPQALAKEADKLRAELAVAKRNHALQKLESPATLRTLRRRLARVLTLQSSSQSKQESA